MGNRIRKKADLKSDSSSTLAFFIASQNTSRFKEWLVSQNVSRDTWKKSKRNFEQLTHRMAAIVWAECPGWEIILKRGQVSQIHALKLLPGPIAWCRGNDFYSH